MKKNKYRRGRSPQENPLIFSVFLLFGVNDRNEIESMYDLDVLHLRTNEMSAFGNGPPANGLGDLTPSAKMNPISS